MTILTKDDLKGKSHKQKVALIRLKMPELIKILHEEAKAQLEREGLIQTKLEGIAMRRKISARAGIKNPK